MEVDGELARVIRSSRLALDELCTRFSQNPTLFFTEADLASCFICSFVRIDEGRTYPDVKGVRHWLAHAGYPTPFRCSMEGYGFEIMPEDSRTLKGGKFKRGHYDVVVLNPCMVRSLPTVAVLGQNLRFVRSEVLPKIQSHGPLIAHGLEFQLCRNRLSDEGAERFAAGLAQDARKLAAASTEGLAEHQGFIQCHETIGFVWSKNDAVSLGRLIGNDLKIRIVPGC